jgi:hypothetical protein
VDLVVVNRAPPDLVHRILRDGERVFERDASARIQFEIRARNEYFDLLPYITEYRQASSTSVNNVDARADARTDE